MILVEQPLKLDHMDYDAISMYQGKKFGLIMPTRKNELVESALEYNAVFAALHEGSGYISKNLLWEALNG